MAEATAAEYHEYEFPGAKKCQAPGCPNWFLPAGNRHRYCKAPTCTYKRGAPSEPELHPPYGAAEEAIRRMQADEGEGEVGPDMLAHRRRAVNEALRQRDSEDFAGALIDEATACMWLADRTRLVGLPPVPDQGGPLAAAPRSKPTGLAAAAISSHRRTVALAERRMSLLIALIAARGEMQSSERAVKQTAGSEKEADAQDMLILKRTAHREAKANFDQAEAAWRERLSILSDLVDAVAGQEGRAAAA